MPAVGVGLLAFDDQAGLDQRCGDGVVAICAEHGLERLPVVRRVAQAEVPGDLTGQAAALEVLDGAGGAAQLLAVVVAGARHDVAQGDGLGLPLGAGGGRQATALLRHRHADRLRQIADGLDVRQPGELHQEADCRAVRAATEAVIELLGRRHRERRRLLVMERAQPHEVGAALLELHVAAHHVDDVDAVEQIVDERLRNHA